MVLALAAFWVIENPLPQAVARAKREPRHA
jgi:hypothetical protein